MIITFLDSPHLYISLTSHLCLVFNQRKRLRHLRSTLHPDGADVVQSAVLDVAALGGELQALALEMLLLEHSHLRETWRVRNIKQQVTSLAIRLPVHLYQEFYNV